MIFDVIICYRKITSEFNYIINIQVIRLYFGILW